MSGKLLVTSIWNIFITYFLRSFFKTKYGHWYFLLTSLHFNNETVGAFLESIVRLLGKKNIVLIEKFKELVTSKQLRETVVPLVRYQLSSRPFLGVGAVVKDFIREARLGEISIQSLPLGRSNKRAQRGHYARVVHSLWNANGRHANNGRVWSPLELIPGLQLTTTVLQQRMRAPISFTSLLRQQTTRSPRGWRKQQGKLSQTPVQRNVLKRGLRKFNNVHLNKELLPYVKHYLQTKLFHTNPESQKYRVLSRRQIILTTSI